MRKVLLISLFYLPLVTQANDFPTIDSVRFVLDCMAENGGQNDENLYTCSCRHDVIQSQLTFNEFETATLYKRYRSMPGKRGGLFREGGDELKKKLAVAEEEAMTQCPRVIHIERKVKNVK